MPFVPFKKGAGAKSKTDDTAKPTGKGKASAKKPTLFKGAGDAAKEAAKPAFLTKKK